MTRCSRTMQGFRALVVDDSKFARAVVKRLISELRPDWVIEEAGDGTDALDRCMQPGSNFDVVVMDMHMPKMDGIKLAGELRSRNCAAKLVLLTANVQDAVKTRAQELELEFVGKPLNRGKLTSLLDKMSV